MKKAFAVGNVDNVIDQSMATILDKKLGTPLVLGAAAPRLETAAGTALSTIGPAETLYLDGHGAAAESAPGVPMAAVKFGGMTPEQLADALVAKGLPSTYAGKIYLNGCNTANTNGGETYAARFQKAMALRGVAGCTVKGNAGYSQVVPATGKTRVIPATAGGATERAALNRLKDEAEVLAQEAFALHGYLTSNPTASDAAAKQAEFKLKVSGVKAKKLLADAQWGVTYLDTKGLRPTLPALNAITHYESGAGVYTALPAATGRSGKTLRQHVAAALASYAKKWKFNQSDASRAAVPVLNRLLGNHAALLMAVRWYLRLGPRPPAQLAPVGAQLNTDSSFYGFLRAEFLQWS